MLIRCTLTIAMYHTLGSTVSADQVSDSQARNLKPGPLHCRYRQHARRYLRYLRCLRCLRYMASILDLMRRHLALPWRNRHPRRSQQPAERPILASHRKYLLHRRERRDRLSAGHKPHLRYRDGSQIRRMRPEQSRYQQLLRGLQPEQWGCLRYGVDVAGDQDMVLAAICCPVECSCEYTRSKHMGTPRREVRRELRHRFELPESPGCD